MLTIPELQEARQPRNLVKPCNCSHCGAGLRQQAAVVIATRNCPECGRRAVSEPENNDAPPPFTPEQLDDAHAAYTGSQSRIAYWALAGFVILMVGNLVAVFYRDTIRDAIRPIMDPGWFGVLLLLALSAVFLTIVARVATQAKRAAPKCPHCQATIQRLVCLTQVTGNCCECGRRLVEPPADEPTGPFPTVEEFDAATKRHARSVNRAGWIVMAATWFLWLAGIVTAAVSFDRERYWQRLEDRYGPVNAAIVGSGIVCVVILGALVVTLAMWRKFERWTKAKREADPLLNCPHCKAGLHVTCYVIASKRCPTCRKRVLADPEPEAVAGS